MSLSLDHRPILHAYDSLPLAFADQLLTPILSKFLFNFQHDSTQLERNKPGFMRQELEGIEKINRALEILKLIKNTMLMINHNTSLCRDMHQIFFVSVRAGIIFMLSIVPIGSGSHDDLTILATFVVNKR